ncbi:Angiopoietin-related protein 2, partial [Dissostichus eleginoides]
MEKLQGKLEQEGSLAMEVRALRKESSSMNSRIAQLYAQLLHEVIHKKDQVLEQQRVETLLLNATTQALQVSSNYRELENKYGVLTSMMSSQNQIIARLEKQCQSRDTTQAPLVTSEPPKSQPNVDRNYSSEAKEITNDVQRDQSALPPQQEKTVLSLNTTTANTPTDPSFISFPVTKTPGPWRDCQHVLESGETTSGIYLLRPQSANRLLQAWCEQSRDEGGWTVIQRRQDGSVNFFRTWEQYKQGFGNLDGEYWLGLEHLYWLTKQAKYKLRVAMEDWQGRQFMLSMTASTWNRRAIGIDCDADSICPTELNPLTLDVPRVIANYGASVELNCTSTEADHDGMYWRIGNNNSKINLEESFISQSVSLSEWNVTAECRIMLNETHECSKELEITIYQNPTVTVFQVNREVEGTLFELQFNISRAEHGAEFRCEAQLDFGSHGPQLPVHSDRYIVSVNYAPEFKNTSEEFFVHEGDDVTLNFAPEINEGTYSKEVKLDGNVTLDCSAEGNPLPDLHWNYTTAENVRETTRGHQKSLTITGATSTNAGVYICAATNNVGKVTSTVTLKMMKGKRSVFPWRFLWWLPIGLIVVFIVIVIVIVHKRWPWRDCQHVLESGETTSGIYLLRPQSANRLLQAWCEQSRDEGRVDGHSEETGWLCKLLQDLGTQGFGNLDGEYWLGLEHLYWLTKQAKYKLRVAMEDWQGRQVYAEYDSFHLEPESDWYRLRLGQYQGNAGDSLSWHNNKAFTTLDRDKDGYTGNCAHYQKGGWWYHMCAHSNLNGVWYRGGHYRSRYQDGVYWAEFHGGSYSLKRVSMMIKPKMLGLLMLMLSLCDADSICPTELNPLTLDVPRVIANYGASVELNCTSTEADHDGIESNGHCVSVNREVEGTLFELQCDIADVAPVQNLVVKWFKDNQTIRTDNFTNTTTTPVSESSTLAVNISRAEHGAEFRCEAQLDFGSHGPQLPVHSDRYIVSVNYAPEFKNTSEEFFVHEETPDIVSVSASDPGPVMEGTENQLKYKPLIKACQGHIAGVEHEFSLDKFPCQADGNPLPIFLWYYDGKIINASEPLTRTQSGKYTAEVSNPIGSSNISVDITIEYGPTFTCDDRYEVEVNSKLCEPDGNPKPDIKWFKNGTIVDSPWQSKTKHDSGCYMMNATNSHGTATHKLKLDVLFAPEINEGTYSKEVKLDGNVTLDCSAEGNPLPDLHWNYTTAENVRETTRGHQKSLTITGATSTNAGVYICAATNNVGKDQYDIIEKHTQSGLELVEKYVKFVKERTEIEQNYAKQLRNLSKKYNPKRSGKDEPEC